MPSIQLAVSNIAWNKADDELIYTSNMCIRDSLLP